MPRVQGYEITVKGFLPVDANDPENVAKAAKAIRDAKDSGNFAGLQGLGLMKFDQKFTTKDSGAYRLPAAPVEGPVGEQTAGDASDDAGDDIGSVGSEGDGSEGEGGEAEGGEAEGDEQAEEPEASTGRRRR